MEPTDSMTGKRASENDGDGDSQQLPQQPGRKHQDFDSVIWEALKVESLQKLCSWLEPVVRSIVREEVKCALAKNAPPRNNEPQRSSPKWLEGPDGRILHLHFRSRLSLPLFTGGEVGGE